MSKKRLRACSKAAAAPSSPEVTRHAPKAAKGVAAVQIGEEILGAMAAAERPRVAAAALSLRLGLVRLILNHHLFTTSQCVFIAAISFDS
mmetsp:Transcript_22733/g.38398  ORF Transcript_22733/g.38398 Transcript_22733/m.38398 type:complete len:90 (-) Transcript_22733:375-644(-)